MVQKATLTSMFIAALFTIAKTWNQHKCPLTEEWIKKMWYVCTINYCSAIKKKDLMPFMATRMDPETVMLSEIVRQRSRNNLKHSLYGESKQARCK